MSSVKVANQLGGKAKFCSTPNTVDIGDYEGIRVLLIVALQS